MPVAKLPVSSGFQFDGGEYAVPLVYSVSFRGKLVTPLAAGDDGEADGDVVVLLLLLLLDDELLQALAVASASTATAAVPYLVFRHRRLVVLPVGLTCSYLLISKSCDDPGSAAAGSRKSAACRDGAPTVPNDPFPERLSVLGSASPWRVRYPAAPVPAVEQVGYTG